METRFDALGVVVSDMAASVAFYRQLGLAFPDGAEKEGHAEANLPGGTRLMLDSEATMASFDPDFESPQGPGRISLAFLCEAPADVDGLHAELLAAGHSSLRSPFDAFWGQRYATVLDPDGNTVDLFAPLGS
jgi:catechol 2,3-dioxygenase-like lactoylglutathione lyase family enzyme